MSHELTIREDGKVEMAYTGADPWHWRETKPTKLEPGASIPEWVHAAGMEWTVETAPVHFAIDGAMQHYKGREVLYRSDNGYPLGVVSEDYCILQPRECVEFFEDLVQSIGLTLETAGTMFGGKRFWALAKIGEGCLIDKRDPIKGYLLLTSSADGLRATEARFTSVRVVCRNTLRMSDEKDSKGQIKISHRSQWDADRVKQRLGVAPKTFEQFLANMRALADVKMTNGKAETETRTLLGIEKDAQKPGKRFERIMDLFRGMATGIDEPGFRNTAYGWVHCVTEAVDHGSRAASDSHRLYNALMGPGDVLKTKAMSQALELVG
jgi:phage/plasmid-like protein (TIGR03299 family)